MRGIGDKPETKENKLTLFIYFQFTFNCIADYHFRTSPGCGFADGSFIKDHQGQPGDKKDPTG